MNKQAVKILSTEKSAVFSGSLNYYDARVVLPKAPKQNILPVFLSTNYTRLLKIIAFCVNSFLWEQCSTGVKE